LALLEDADARYRQAEPQVRRLINQALFDALLLSEDDSTEAKPHAWVTEIHRVARMQSGSRARRRNDHHRLSAAVGFNKAPMVPRAGLEPAPPD
jgi:hypothetical protein